MRRLISSPCRRPASSSTIRILVIAFSVASQLRHLRGEGSHRLLPRLGSAGEEQTEGGAAAGLGLDLDGAAVRGDDLLHQGQAEACAGTGRGSGTLCTGMRFGTCV